MWYGNVIFCKERYSSIHDDGLIVGEAVWGYVAPPTKSEIIFIVMSRQRFASRSENEPDFMSTIRDISLIRLTTHILGSRPLFWV